MPASSAASAASHDPRDASEGSDAGHDDVERMLTWRRRGTTAFFVTLFAAPALRAADLAEVAWLVVALCLALTAAVWVTLFHAARVHGGTGYAIGHVAVSILLTPAFYLGVLLVPLLVESDVRQGVAGWRRDRHGQWLERGLRLVSGVVALFLGGLVFLEIGNLWGLPIGLAVAALVLRTLNGLANRAGGSA